MKIFFVIANDKFVAPLAKLVNEYMLANKFNTAIIVTPGRDVSEFPIPQYDNVYSLNFNQIKFSATTRRIIWQGLSKSAVDYLYKHRSLLKKSFWTIFGGDLYGAQQNRKNDYVRKNFKALITGHDYEFYKRRYHVEKEVYQAVTPSPVWNFEQLSSLKKKQKDFVSIQINQSANRYTIEMLQKLARFANENIRVYTILSYGDMDYKEQIEQTGKEIFGDKFVPISTWMNTEEYAKHLANIDVFIHYDDRQSAFGNICCSMYLGTKVYVRNDLDYWKDFVSMDCRVYDINQIDEITFSDISSFTQEIREHNRKVISEFFAMKNIASKWEQLLKQS